MFPNVNQQALQMDDFALSVLNSKPVRLPGEMGRRDVKIIQAVYESMRTGKRIEIV
ncbi:MAG: Gfo/Idh/MocA family oxidoreductase [Bacteroidota bacterium]